MLGLEMFSDKEETPENLEEIIGSEYDKINDMSPLNKKEMKHKILMLQLKKLQQRRLARQILSQNDALDPMMKYLSVNKGEF